MGCAVHVAGLPGSELSAGLSPNVSYHAVDFPLLRTGRLMGLMIRHDIDVAHAHLGLACKALAAVRAPVRKVATLHVGYKPHQHAGLDGYRGQSRVIANWIPTPRPSVRTELGLPPETLIIGTVGRLHAGLPVIATRTDGPMEYMPDQPITLVEPDSVPPWPVPYNCTFSIRRVGRATICGTLTRRPISPRSWTFMVN